MLDIFFSSICCRLPRLTSYKIQRINNIISYTFAFYYELKTKVTVHINQPTKIDKPIQMIGSLLWVCTIMIELANILPKKQIITFVYNNRDLKKRGSIESKLKQTKRKPTKIRVAKKLCINQTNKAPLNVIQGLLVCQIMCKSIVRVVQSIECQNFLFVLLC